MSHLDTAATTAQEATMHDPTMYCRDCGWSGPASTRIKIESEPAHFIACGPGGSTTGYGTFMRNHCPTCNGTRMGMTPTEDWQRHPDEPDKGADRS